MDLYIARQPILDTGLHTFGYELLYRRSTENRFPEADGNEATSNVIVNSFTVAGIDRLTEGRCAFVNFTESLLLEGVATLFPREILVVELLENLHATPGLLEACRSLKAKGYHIALDDFVDSPGVRPFLDVADIIKVDFTKTSYRECQAIVRRLSNGHLRFLAEKVETEAEFAKAQSWGYTLFQGYFFSKPVMQPMGEVPPMQVSQMRLLERIHSEQAEYSELSDIMQTDVSLSYKLLRLINSSAFGLDVRVESVHHALVMLGMRELRKWVSLIVMRAIAERKPDELIRQSLIRARMMEEIGKQVRGAGEADERFLIGLFSHLEVLMGRPMAELLAGLALPPSVRTALLQQEGIPGYLLVMVCAYERSDWKDVSRIADQLGIAHGALFPAFLDAVVWSEELLEAGPSPD